MTVPPCCSAMRRQTGRLRHGPMSLAPEDEVARSGSKTASRLPGGMPGPSSATAIVTWSSARLTRTVMTPEAGVTETALSRSVSTSRSSWLTSPCTRARPRVEGIRI